jgi:hypothetical protein
VRRDLLLALLLAIAAISLSLRSSRALAHGLLDDRNEDTWFDADIPRVYGDMTDGADTDRKRGLVLHPAFGLVTRPAVAALRWAFGLEAQMAVRCTLVTEAALWIALLFACLRAMGCRRPDAALVALVALSSAGAFFWLGVPETYALASIGILAAFLLTAVGERRFPSDAWYVGVTALAFAFTLTNGAYALLVAFLQRPWKRAVAIAGAGLAIVLLLLATQVVVHPEGRLFPRGRREARFLQFPGPERIARVTVAAMVHTVVMPGLGRIAQPRRDGSARLCLSVQQEPPSGDGWGLIGTCAWAVLSAIGLWALVTLRTHRSLRLTLAAGLGFELTLRAFYGPETFLAALHFVPLLVGIAALATFTRARHVALMLAGVVAISATVNNASRFDEAVAFYGREGRPPRIPPALSPPASPPAAGVP